MKLTLRIKIIGTLLLCSLSSVVLIAAITPPLLEKRFLEKAHQDHLQRFEQLIGRYLGQTTTWGGEASAIDFYKRIIVADRNRQTQRPPRPRHDRFASERMRFVLADHEGYVIHPYFDYQAGQRLTEAEQREASSLYWEGEPVGMALARGPIFMSEVDEVYLDLLQRSLLNTGAFALVMAVLLGWLVTRPMLRRLNRLTHAARTMTVGSISRLAEDTGRDEIATLTREFNCMSQTLSEQYKAIEDSHATISKQAQTLERLSYTDPLTELYNRRYFEEQFQAAWIDAGLKNTPLALILLDVDHFKLINDNFSHQTGDTVLQTLAQILQEVIRSQDILARYGGEELVLLMPNTHLKQAEEVSQRMRASIELFEWRRVAIGLSVTASFGVTGMAGCNSPREMLKRADDQLYRAKEAGRNRVCIA